MKKFLCSIFAVILMLSFVACNGGDESKVKPFEVKGKKMTLAEVVMWENNMHNLAQKAEADSEDLPAWCSVDYKVNANITHLKPVFIETASEVYASTDIKISGKLLTTELLSEDSSFDFDIKIHYTDKEYIKPLPNASEETIKEGTKVIAHNVDMNFRIVALKADEVYVDYDIVMEGDDNKDKKLNSKVQCDIDSLSFDSIEGFDDEWQYEILDIIERALTQSIQNSFPNNLELSDVVRNDGKVCKNGRGVAVEFASDGYGRSLLLRLKCDFKENQYKPEYLDIYTNLVADTRNDFHILIQSLMNIKPIDEVSLKKPDGDYKSLEEK